MAITYPISLPTSPAPARVTMKAIDVVAANASPFTSEEQVYAHPGERWEAEITTPPMTRDQAEAWIAALVSLRGRYGTLLLGDTVGKNPRGAVSGSPVVNGSGHSGFELPVRSMPLSTAGVFKAGDYVQLGAGSSARLYKILQDVDSNGSGVATLDIWPRLRTSPADGQAVIYQNTVGVFRLLENVRSWAWDIPVITSITLSAREAL